MNILKSTWPAFPWWSRMIPTRLFCSINKSLTHRWGLFVARLVTPWGWLDERFKNYAPDTDFTMRMIDAGKKIAPILGKIVWHHKIDDENRIVMGNNAKSDNSELGRIWKPRRFDIQKKFERNSYCYFSNLGIRFSNTYGCDMLDIPSDPKIENPAPDPPYEITYPRFYRVMETIYRIESFLRSIGKK